MQITDALVLLSESGLFGSHPNFTNKLWIEPASNLEAP